MLSDLLSSGKTCGEFLGAWGIPAPHVGKVWGLRAARWGLGTNGVRRPAWACDFRLLHFCVLPFPLTEQFCFDAVPEIFWQWVTGTWRKGTVCSTAGIFWWTTVCFTVSCLFYSCRRIFCFWEHFYSSTLDANVVWLLGWTKSLS